MDASPEPVSDWQRALASLPQGGRVEWIGLRPARGVSVQAVKQVRALAGRGLDGDRYSGRGARQVTLLQQEHLAVLAALTGHEQIDPAWLRRNLLISGLNLLALRQRRFRVGGAILAFSGLCHPCSKMERALGAGGLNAMRGHGGINARVVETGQIRLGDPVRVVDD